MEQMTGETIRGIFGTTDTGELRAIAEKARLYDGLNRHNSRNAGRKSRFSAQDTAQMLWMRQEGKTMQEIAGCCHTSRQTIAKYLCDAQMFRAHPDAVLRLYYMNKSRLCTVIDVNFRDEKIYLENFTEKPLLRAFGVKETPTWEDFEEFLADRCLPRSRADIKSALRDLGVPFYDPLSIIEVTNGKMAGDDQWLLVVHRKKVRPNAAL